MTLWGFLLSNLHTLQALAEGVSPPCSVDLWKFEGLKVTQMSLVIKIKTQEMLKTVSANVSDVVCVFFPFFLPPLWQPEDSSHMEDGH